MWQGYISVGVIWFAWQDGLYRTAIQRCVLQPVERRRYYSWRVRESPGCINEVWMPDKQTLSRPYMNIDVSLLADISKTSEMFQWCSLLSHIVSLTWDASVTLTDIELELIIFPELFLWDHYVCMAGTGCISFCGIFSQLHFRIFSGVLGYFTNR